jgi:putative oxidoreductase
VLPEFPPAAFFGRAAWLPPLLARACVGTLFASTGWEATHNLADVSAFFAQLRIPAPDVSAALADYTELVCGALLVVGLASRLATLPLLVCMTVALATAKAGKVHGFRDLLMQVEFAYSVLLVVLALLGPGRISLDSFVVPRLRRSRWAALLG